MVKNKKRKEDKLKSSGGNKISQPSGYSSSGRVHSSKKRLRNSLDQENEQE